MSGEITYQSMYDLGYKDALDDIRDLIYERLKQIDGADESRRSYFAGMKVALESVSEATYSMKG